LGNFLARWRLDLIDRRLSHYHITAAVGAGGMGEVYRATDTKLGREVALKVLPAEMARDPQRLMRFQREARAVAALNHPHIVTIFSVEQADDIHFLTMEFVAGQPLDRLIPEGGLSVERILEIGTALAGALTAAHEKGIVHRDLKPANVMVTKDGRVKVLDFGLAKDTRPPDSGDATQSQGLRTEAGVVMGTPAYMSPEQVAGEVVDCRTDIFSLGIVLYEMASGQRPFKGRSSAELVTAILRDTPRDISDMRADLPASLARVIKRCLEKNPQARVQTARDVYNELRELPRQPATTILEPVRSTAGSATAGSDSGAARADEGFWVAVIPFRYAGANSDLVALAEGLCEDVVTGLSRFSYLRVIARSSSSRYAQELIDVRTAGKALGARYVMEGSLRQAGTKVRIAVQLVDTNSGTHLWAETYDRPFSAETVFELQDDLVSRIVSTVADSHGVLPHSMSEAVRAKGSDQLSPYEALLHSFGYFERVSAEEHVVTRDNLERATQQAPNHAGCLAMLTIIYAEEYIHGFNARPDPLGRALATARRATEAAPSDHLAFHALATVLYYRGERQAFRNAAERAVALNPMDGYTAAYQGFLTAYNGDWERGCALAERARKLNPHHPGWYWFASVFNAYRRRDYRMALDAALKINMPRFWRAHLALAAIYGQLGERAAASTALRQLLLLKPEFAAAPRQELAKTWDPDMVEHLLDGLRQAGLEVAGDARAAAAPPAAGPAS
jgi:serine/threonine protein kinase/Flp pilus assembly protein TadD